VIDKFAIKIYFYILIGIISVVIGISFISIITYIFNIDAIVAAILYSSALIMIVLLQTNDYLKDILKNMDNDNIE